MPIPDFQTIMLPALKILAKGEVMNTPQIREKLSKQFKLNEEEKNELLPSGTVPRFDNNVSWALTFLVKAKLIEKPTRGQYLLSERGKKTLRESPDRVDMRFLTRFPEYVEWRGQSKRQATSTPANAQQIEHTPEELIGSGYQIFRETLTKEILERTRGCTPRFFERLVVELLLRMGYGGSLPEAGQIVGKSGDGGIDGVIKEDKLGLDFVYIQAKRWENSVGRPLVQAFAGSLLGHGARKGVMITTSYYTPEAREFVKTLGDQKIVLIDGNELAALMIDYNVGVSTVSTYEIKKIDSDYFEEE